MARSPSFALSNRLSGLGRLEEALQACEQSVDIRRKLAEARPDAFLPDLSVSLNNLSNRLSELGRREDAFKASQEALDSLWPFAEQHPAAFGGGLLTMAKNWMRDLEACEQEPDTETLQRLPLFLESEGPDESD